MLWKFCSVKLGLHAKIFQPSPRPSRLSDRVTLRTLDFSSGKLWNRLSQGLANPPDSPWLDNCGHPWMAILNQNLTGQDATEQIQLNYCFENVINKEPTKWIWITIWYTICDMCLHGQVLVPRWFFLGCNVMRLFGLMSFPVKSELCILFALAHVSQVKARQLGERSQEYSA